MCGQRHWVLPRFELFLYSFYTWSQCWTLNQYYTIFVILLLLRFCVLLYRYSLTSNGGQRRRDHYVLIMLFCSGQWPSIYCLSEARVESVFSQQIKDHESIQGGRGCLPINMLYWRTRFIIRIFQLFPDVLELPELNAHARMGSYCKVSALTTECMFFWGIFMTNSWNNFS